eukprot:9151193-Lingulodinium_polyedra.AAC.1
MALDSMTGFWEVIPVTVGSGAVDAVGPRNVAKAFPIVETEDSKNGRNYRAANGSTIRNHGEKVVRGKTKEGQDLTMKMAVADVSKVLASVARMCECGNRVVFDEEGSYVQNKKTGMKTNIEKRSGVYVMDLMVKQESRGPAQGQSRVRFCGTCEEGCKGKECKEQDFRRLGEEML